MLDGCRLDKSHGSRTTRPDAISVRMSWSDRSTLGTSAGLMGDDELAALARLEGPRLVQSVRRGDPLLVIARVHVSDTHDPSGLRAQIPKLLRDLRGVHLEATHDSFSLCIDGRDNRNFITRDSSIR